MHRIPHGEETYHRYRGKHQQHIRQMYADRIGIDHEIAAASQRDEAETLLKKAKQQPQHDASQCTECGNQTTLKEEDFGNQTVVSTKVPQGLHILALVQNQHGQGAYHIEARDSQDKGKEKIGDELLYFHDAEHVGLLLIAVLHGEVVAQNAGNLLFDYIRIGLRLQLQFYRRDLRAVTEQATGKSKRGENIAGIVFLLVDHEHCPWREQMARLKEAEGLARLTRAFRLGAYICKGSTN